MVVLACVDTVSRTVFVFTGFAPNVLPAAAMRFSWPTLYLSLPFLLEISITITCQLAVPDLGPPSHDDDQWFGGSKANVLRWNLATTLTV